ncbi:MULTISPECIES: bifunctional adenosylcobinamide kinase/adenosylcobinamide-phosphate guanylyltransferase [unclassified Marinovum]
MARRIIVTGGARSGKSSFAEGLVLSMPGQPVYIATAEAGDGEMAARIARHQAGRGAKWHTVEAPHDLVAALEQSDGGGPRLVDCLTLWLSNLMLAGSDWQAEADRLVAALQRQTAPVVLVTNEVGLSIVPENALARAFRDAAGLLGQQVAAACDEAWLVALGCPMQLKPQRRA